MREILITLIFLFSANAYANEAIPIEFSQGDVLSAEVLNNIFSRINQATDVVESEDLIGSWGLVQYMPYDGQPGNGSCRLIDMCDISGTTDSPDELTRFREDIVEFTEANNVYTYNTSSYKSFAADGNLNIPESGSFTVLADIAIFKNSEDTRKHFYAQKKGEALIILREIQSASNSFNVIILEKLNQPPLPPTKLAATVSENLIELSWEDQSDDETGFEIQSKTALDSEWTIAATSDENETLADVVGLSGNNWFRVISVNENGSSISSNEILIEVE